MARTTPIAFDLCALRRLLWRRATFRCARVSAARFPGVHRILGEVASACADAVAHELGADEVSRVCALTPLRETRLGQRLKLLNGLEER
jgi:hypothetical protein